MLLSWAQGALRGPEGEGEGAPALVIIPEVELFGRHGRADRLGQAGGVGHSGGRGRGVVAGSLCSGRRACVCRVLVQNVGRVRRYGVWIDGGAWACGASCQARVNCRGAASVSTIVQVRRPPFDPLGQKQLQLACRRSEARPSGSGRQD